MSARSNLNSQQAMAIKHKRKHMSDHEENLVPLEEGDIVSFMEYKSETEHTAVVEQVMSFCTGNCCNLYLVADAWRPHHQLQFVEKTPPMQDIVMSSAIGVGQNNTMKSGANQAAARNIDVVMHGGKGAPARNYNIVFGHGKKPAAPMHTKFLENIISGGHSAVTKMFVVAGSKKLCAFRVSSEGQHVLFDTIVGKDNEWVRFKYQQQDFIKYYPKLWAFVE